MLKLGGNDAPSKADVTTALSAVGIEADSARLDQLLGDLEGKDLNEVIESGKDMLATFGGGGGGGGAAAGGDAGGDAGEAAAKEEEVEEEADIGAAADMFGGGDGGGDY